MKKILFAAGLIISLSITSLAGFNLSDLIPGGSSGGGSSAQEASPENHLGMGFSPEFEIDCSGGGLLDFLDMGSDICSAANGFTSKIGENFSLGGCNIELGGSGQCYLDSIKSMCVKKEGDIEGMISPLRSAVNSPLEFKLLKGVGFRSTKDCGDEEKYEDVEYPSGLTQGDIYEKTDAKVMAKKGYNVFSSDIDLVRDCMKTYGNKCIDEDDFIKLPKDSLEAEKEIMKAAQAISQANDSVTANMPSVEAKAKNALNACKLLPDAAQELCERAVKEEDASPDKASTREIAKIEMASAIELSMMRKATRGDTYYVYKNKKFIDKLPMKMRQQYADGVARQNAADGLIMALYSELTSLKKEAIRAAYGNAMASAEPYKAGAGVDALANKFGLNATGDGGDDSASGTEGGTDSSGSGTDLGSLVGLITNFLGF